MKTPYFFDESITGKLASSIDWSKHSLGPAESWPVSLKTLLGFIFRNNHPMFLFWGDDLTCFYNDAYMPSFGVGKHPTAMGQKGIECWPEIWHIIGPQIDQVLSTGVATWNVNHLVPIFRNGKIEEVYWTYSYSPALDENGKRVGVMVTCTETTESVMAQRETDKMKDELYTLFQKAPFPLAMLSGPEHRFRFANNMYVNFILGDVDYSGKSVEELLPTAKTLGFLDLLDTVYKTGVRYEAENAFFETTVNGTKRSFYFDFIYEPIRDRNGEIEGILAAVTDVTDHVLFRKKLEENKLELDKAIEVRDDFLSIASHELKTPLTSLLLQSQQHQRFLDNKDDRAYEKDRVDRNAAQTNRLGKRLNRLVDDMLDISRIRTGKLSMQKEQGSISAIVKSVLQKLEGQIHDYGVKVNFTGVEDSGVFDPFRIEQVITNLLMNAFLYGNKKPVEVTVTEVNNNIRCTVKDNGIGIAKEFHESIFNRFERVGGTGQVSGFGLGLFISQQIVNAHGGRIWVESEVNQGSSFTFEIPKA
ncbi:MAG: ATP-binding protein [Bdellovibrionota bacterium]